MKKVKKVLNIEYDLTSDEFIDQKLDSVCEKYQTIYPDLLCKVTTFCVANGHFVNGTTQSNVDFMGAPSKMLGSNPMANSSMITLDDDMVRTYEFTITADTDLPDYVTALNVAQSNADNMFEADSSKIPLITVIDYRWGNDEFTVSASIFSTTDEDGNIISLVGSTDSAANVVVGDTEAGKQYEENKQYLPKYSESVLDEDGEVLYKIATVGVPTAGKLSKITFNSYTLRIALYDNDGNRIEVPEDSYTIENEEYIKDKQDGNYTYNRIFNSGDIDDYHQKFLWSRTYSDIYNVEYPYYVTITLNESIEYSRMEVITGDSYTTHKKFKTILSINDSSFIEFTPPDEDGDYRFIKYYIDSEDFKVASNLNLYPLSYDLYDGKKVPTFEFNNIISGIDYLQLNDGDSFTYEELKINILGTPKSYTLNEIKAKDGLIGLRLYDKDGKLIPYEDMDITTSGFEHDSSAYHLNCAFNANKQFNENIGGYALLSADEESVFTFNTPLEVSRIERISGMEYPTHKSHCDISINGSDFVTFGERSDHEFNIEFISI